MGFLSTHRRSCSPFAGLGGHQAPSTRRRPASVTASDPMTSGGHCVPEQPQTALSLRRSVRRVSTSPIIHHQVQRGRACGPVGPPGPGHLSRGYCSPTCRAPDLVVQCEDRSDVPTNGGLTHAQLPGHTGLGTPVQAVCLDEPGHLQPPFQREHLAFSIETTTATSAAVGVVGPAGKLPTLRAHVRTNLPLSCRSERRVARR